MKALRYYGARDVRYEAMDDPAPQSTRDAIVKVEACSICGSDLHIYHGHGFSEDIGFCVGHEAVGEVMETGSGVHRLKVGDKVMIPAAVGCGACRACLAGVINLCEFGMGACYGLSAKLQGSQADAVRVPAADMNAVRLPEGVSMDQALMMTDALATAEKIAGLSLPATMVAKEAVNRAFETTLREGILFERRMFNAAFATEDQKEGMAAFLQKREAQFRDR